MENNKLIDYKKMIEEYTPFNEQEEKDKELILDFIDKTPNILSRESRIAHMTASSWICNETHTKVLMVYHKIYDSWSWTGGHADGDSDLLNVAIKEAKEETGISHIRPLSERIFSLESLTVDGHVKKGEYVSSHLHLNVTFLLEAKESDILHIKEDENKGVAWFTLAESLTKPTEPWFVEHIYKKLNQKLKCR